MVIKVSDDDNDDDDKHKRKLNLDLDALGIRERELKRREDVLVSKESAFSISKQQDENESKLSSTSSASSVFNNVSNSAAISNFNDSKQNNLGNSIRRFFFVFQRLRVDYDAFWTRN